MPRVSGETVSTACMASNQFFLFEPLLRLESVFSRRLMGFLLKAVFADISAIKFFSFSRIDRSCHDGPKWYRARPLFILCANWHKLCYDVVYSLVGLTILKYADVIYE